MSKDEKTIIMIVSIMIVLAVGGLFYVYGILIPGRERQCMERGGYQFEVTRAGQTCWREDGTKIFL